MVAMRVEQPGTRRSSLIVNGVSVLLSDVVLSFTRLVISIDVAQLREVCSRCRTRIGFVETWSRLCPTTCFVCNNSQTCWFEMCF